jgi:DedD protein
LRARARRRLIGAVALVLLGVIVFPLVFDSTPKPVPSNIALEIPQQNKAPALSLPASAPVLGAASAAAVPPAERTAAPGRASAPAAAPAAKASLPKPPAAVASAAPAAAAPPKTAAKPVAKPVPPPSAPKPAAAARPPAAQASSKEIESARQALAALEGKSPDQISMAQVEAALAHKAQAAQQQGAGPNARFVVQAGAYADAHTARAVRDKIENAGLKTYTQVVDTPQGKRVRVRVGPFTTREQAERALHELQALGLNGAVLTL